MLMWGEQYYASNGKMTNCFTAWNRLANFSKKNNSKSKKAAARKRVAPTAMTMMCENTFPVDLDKFRTDVVWHTLKYLIRQGRTLDDIFTGKKSPKVLTRDDRSKLGASFLVTHAMSNQPGRLCDYSALTVTEAKKWWRKIKQEGQTATGPTVTVVETNKRSVVNPVVPWVGGQETAEVMQAYDDLIRPVLCRHYHAAGAEKLASDSDLTHVHQLMQDSECTRRLNAVKAADDGEHVVLEGRKHPTWAQYFGQAPPNGWELVTTWQTLRDAYNMSEYNTQFVVDAVGSGGVGQTGVLGFLQLVHEATKVKLKGYNCWRKIVADRCHNKDPETVNTILGHTEQVHQRNYKIKNTMAAADLWTGLYPPLRLDLKALGTDNDEDEPVTLAEEAGIFPSVVQ
jgi:hypothetical protein